MPAGLSTRWAYCNVDDQVTVAPQHIESNSVTVAAASSSADAEAELEDCVCAEEWTHTEYVHTALVLQCLPIAVECQHSPPATQTQNVEC